jgi:tetratricopeptide (TPR) repeat protein
VNYISDMRIRLAPLALVFATSLAACGSWSDMRAHNAYLQGHIDQAEKYNDAALDHDPTDLDAKRLGAKIATKRGAAALEQNDTAKARSYFQKAVNLNPTDQVAQDYLKMVGQEMPNVSAPPPPPSAPLLPPPPAPPPPAPRP